MKIAFVSTQNAVRSIMAESIAKKLSRLALISPEVYSAGVKPTDNIPEEVIELLKEREYPVENLRPKGLADIPYEDLHILITLSSEARDGCPYSERHMRREHWVLEECHIPRREELIKLLEQVENLIRGLFKIS
ncbi:MAG: low molecular weight phosphatase family protein [Aquificaceae bacterium]|nr:low molecular weight phosphatase family protein [Aquificaceae bacterium]